MQTYYCAKCREQRIQGCFAKDCPGIPIHHSPERNMYTKQTATGILDSFEDIIRAIAFYNMPINNPLSEQQYTLLVSYYNDRSFIRKQLIEMLTK